MQRLITAIGLIALALFLIFVAPLPLFYAAAVAMSVLCYREYASLVVAHKVQNPGIWGILGGLVILFWPYLSLTGLNLLSALTLFLVVMLVTLLRRSSLGEILPGAAYALLGALYTFGPWRFSIDLRQQSVHLLAFALALNWVGDSAAYYVGRSFGRHKLAPVISPKKSWEGAVGSVIASTVFGLLYLGHFLPLVPWWEIVTMAVLGNVAGQLGDLAESAIKRGGGVKDSGNLLPGHGGMLDRVDSSLFALPVIYIIHSAFTNSTALKP